MPQTKTKYRYPTWWWGNFVFWTGRRWQDESGMEFPASQVNLNQMEIYDEQKHGKHNDTTEVG